LIARSHGSRGEAAVNETELLALRPRTRDPTIFLPPPGPPYARPTVGTASRPEGARSIVLATLNPDFSSRIDAIAPLPPPSLLASAHSLSLSLSLSLSGDREIETRQSRVSQQKSITLSAVFFSTDFRAFYERAAALVNAKLRVRSSAAF